MDYIFEGRSDKEFEDLVAALRAQGREDDAKKVLHLFEMWKRRRPAPPGVQNP